MDSSVVTIDNILIRIPGLSTQEAQNLGEDVARHLSDSLPFRTIQKSLASLDIHVAIPVSTPLSHFSTLIANAILRGLA